MNKILYSGVLVVCFVLWANFGTRGTQEPEKPAINFYGKLVDGRDVKHEIENITISGLYQQVPVYSIPEQSDQDPIGDTTFLDLKEIAQIRSVSLDPRKSIKKFKNYEYIEIIIIPRVQGGKKMGAEHQLHYLVDRSRRIMCDVRTAAGLLEREIAFDSFISLDIDGFLHQDRIEKKEQAVVQPSAAQKALCIDITDALARIEKNISHIKDEKMQTDMHDDITSLKKSTDALCSVY